MRRHEIQTNAPEKIRCAIYTRKSTSEGLEMDFNSLDAQRESGEAYIVSMKHEGWLCLPDYYDDGGFSGSNMDRPGFRQLMNDVENGKIDCLIVYKVDRLSRSLLDFTRIIETLEKHHVSFVSVTQQFNTTHSMGRLTLNILLSFAQFERDIISERTRDKMAAARKKGKWTGGMPVLGYDIYAGGGKLIVNAFEAARIREIFELYLEQQSLLDTAKELNKYGWTTKKWITKKGHERGGKPFNKNNLSSLLGNVLYRGKITYKDEEYEGEHEAIVDEKIWYKVRKLLRHNDRNGGTGVQSGHLRNKHGALLKGLLYCVPCNSVMTHSITTRGQKRYRYYVCTQAQKNGWDTCQTKSLPATEIEAFVIDQIRFVGGDSQLVAKTLEQAKQQLANKTGKLNQERHTIELDMRRLYNEQRALLKEAALEPKTWDPKLWEGEGESFITAKLADMQEKIETSEKRIIEIKEELITLKLESVNGQELSAAIKSFDPVWESLSGREKSRLLHLLIERVGYDGEKESVSLTFRPSGIKALANENANERE